MFLLTAPTAEPVTLDEAKLAARIAGSADFDALIPGLIMAARQIVEQETGLQIMAQTWRIELADWPAVDDVLPVHQATAAAVTYWNGTAWASLDGAAFVFGSSGVGTAIAPATGLAWPTLGERPVGPRVQIDLTAGAASAVQVPECVKLYIKALVAWWIDNPSAAAPGNVQPAPYLRSLLDPVRLWA